MPIYKQDYDVNVTCPRQDFIGFYFNEHHSSDFNIKRVSNSNRYNENLNISLNDKTVDVPNGDGKYYFETNYKEKSFSVNFAFDSLTERNLRELKAWLNGKTIEPLVFDETPYKMYMAKVTGTSTIKYVCFNKKDEQQINTRVYKGEGTINFICYYPLARTPRMIYNDTTIRTGKFLSDYEDAYFPNKSEWFNDLLEEGSTNITNTGDTPTPFIMSYTPSASITDGTTIVIKKGSGQNAIVLNTLTIIGTVPASGNLTWNSKTGILKRGDTLLRYTGNGLFQLPKSSSDTQYTFYLSSTDITSSINIDYSFWYY